MSNEILHIIKYCLGRVAYCALKHLFYYFFYNFKILIYDGLFFISYHGSNVKNGCGLLILFEIRRSSHGTSVYSVNCSINYSFVECYQEDYLIFFYYIIPLPLFFPSLILFFPSMDSGIHIIHIY